VKKKNNDLWALMCPDADQLLAEALEKTDEEVAESLEAKGYDLVALDRELFGLVARLPPCPPRRRGYVALGALGVTVTLTLLAGMIALAAIPAAPPRELPALSTAAAQPPQDSPSNDAGRESVKGPSHP
jgi:hypothetical protein